MVTTIYPSHSFQVNNTFIKVYNVDKGEGLTKHSHDYSHITMCNAGSCKVSLEDRSYIINKNSQPLNLPARQWHEIEALEDETVFVNVFSE